jgi:hypothetical protein
MNANDIVFKLKTSRKARRIVYIAAVVILFYIALNNRSFVTYAATTFIKNAPIDWEETGDGISRDTAYSVVRAMMIFLDDVEKAFVAIAVIGAEPTTWMDSDGITHEGANGDEVAGQLEDFSEELPDSLEDIEESMKAKGPSLKKNSLTVAIRR